VIPVLVVTGPVGVGKSAVLAEADRLLVDADLPHATVVLAEVARCWASTSNTASTPLMYRNLGALWSNFATAGATRLLIEQILAEDSSQQLGYLREVIPDAHVKVVRLNAPISLIEARIRRREPNPEDELSAARWLAPRMDLWKIEDVVVENGERPPSDVASEILHAVGWLR